MLQRNGFSRETSTYIKKNKEDYVVVTADGEIKVSIASRIDQPCLLLGQPVPRNRPLSA